MSDLLKTKDPIEFRFPVDAEWLFITTLILCVAIFAFFIPTANLSTYLLYVSFLLLSEFFVFLSDLSNHKLASLFFFTLGIVIFGSLMAFRNKTGIDDRTYELIFTHIQNNDLSHSLISSNIEKGYILLNYITSFLGITNYCHVITITSYISFLFWGIALWRFRKKCNLTVMVLLLWSNFYFFVMYAGLVRIFISLPIALIAYDLVSQRKIKSFLIMVILGSLFHRSAFILLILTPLFKDSVVYHWKSFTATLFILMPIVFFFVAKVIVPFLGARYSSYGIIGAFNISIGKFDILPLWIIAAYFFQFVDSESKKTYTLGIIALSLSMFFSIWSSLVNLGRLIFYANLGILIIASCIFKQKPVGIIEKFTPCIFVVYSFVYVMHTTFLNPLCTNYLFPYRSYLFE